MEQKKCYYYSIHKILSKGALLAKKLGPVTMDSIYDSANKLNTLTVPFTDDFVKYKIVEITKAISDVDAYIEKIKTTLPDIIRNQTKIGILLSTYFFLLKKYRSIA